MLLLAVEIDLMSLGSIIFTCLTVAGATLTTCWVGVKKLCVYLWGWAEPKVSKAIDEHVGLVVDLRANVPVLTEAVQRLSEASSRHEELHTKTGQKLDEILGRLEEANDTDAN